MAFSFIWSHTTNVARRVILPHPQRDREGIGHNSSHLEPYNLPRQTADVLPNLIVHLVDQHLLIFLHHFRMTFGSKPVQSKPQTKATSNHKDPIMEDTNPTSTERQLLTSIWYLMEIEKKETNNKERVYADSVCYIPRRRELPMWA